MNEQQAPIHTAAGADWREGERQELLFRTDFYDMGACQALAVSIDGKRFAVRFNNEASAAEIVKALRTLASNIEESPFFAQNGEG